MTSRKARELLKILIARSGRILPREEAIEALWPGVAPADATNRLSVALSTVRRALDPVRAHAPDTFITADRAGIALRKDTVSVDLFVFHDSVNRLEAKARRRSRTDHDSDIDELRAVVEQYQGEAFADEPYADWAIPAREATRSVFIGLAHRLVSAFEECGDDLRVNETCSRILESDPYDEPAHRAMVAALDRLGAHGRAAHARTVYQSRLAELGLELSPDPGLSEASPIRRSAS